MRIASLHERTGRKVLMSWKKGFLDDNFDSQFRIRVSVIDLSSVLQILTQKYKLFLTNYVKITPRGDISENFVNVHGLLHQKVMMS